MFKPILKPMGPVWVSSQEEEIFLLVNTMRISMNTFHSYWCWKIWWFYTREILNSFTNFLFSHTLKFSVISSNMHQRNPGWCLKNALQMHYRSIKILLTFGIKPLRLVLLCHVTLLQTLDGFALWCTVPWSALAELRSYVVHKLNKPSVNLKRWASLCRCMWVVRKRGADLHYVSCALTELILEISVLDLSSATNSIKPV